LTDSANFLPVANPYRGIIGIDNSISGATSSALEGNIIDQLLYASRGQNTSDSFHQKLKAIMPKSIFPDSAANLQMTTPQSHSSAAENFLNLTLFMMSNNFFQSKSDFNTDAYNWIKRISNKKLFEYFLSFGGPTAEALTEQIFSLAIEKDDARTVNIILDSGLDHSELKCFSMWEQPITPLERACELGHREVVQALLDAGADANRSTSNERSPLNYAVDCDADDIEDQRHTDIKLIKALLSAGAKVNPTSIASPLVIAARWCQVEVVEFLLSAGADPNSVLLSANITSDSPPDEWEGITPLIEAVQSEADVSKIIAVVGHLLDAGASVHDVCRCPCENTTTILELALSHSSTELIQILLSAGAYVTAFAFIIAVTSNMIDVVNLFLSSKARVPQRAIEAAAKSSNPGLFDLLLKYADPDSTEDLCGRAFVSAIHNGWNEKIDAFFASGTKLQCGPALESAIESAAQRGDLSVIRLLLDKDSPYRANAVKSLGNSLYHAIANGYNKITEILLAAGADVDHGGMFFTAKRPLLEAIRQKDIALSLRLLAAGAIVDYRHDNHTVSVLPHAVACGNYELIKRIIDAGADIDGFSCENKKTPLVVAVEKGDLPAIQLLVDAGADFNASAAQGTGHTALAAAVRNNNIGLVRYLLDHGAALDELSLIAAVCQSLEMMQVLLQARSPRYQDYRRGFGCRALRCAIISSKSLIIEALITSGIDLDLITKDVPYEKEYWKDNSDQWHGVASLQIAIKYDRSDGKWIIQMLLNKGANPNQAMKGEYGRRTIALLLAIEQNSLQIVNMLIAAGAAVNPRPPESMERTPLQYASECGDIDITLALIEHGADVNASPYRDSGATALQFAAIKGYIGIASVLLEKGADINAQPAPKEGRTALEGASEHGRIDMLDFLLKSGVLVTGPGEEQYKRARHFASENGHIAVRRLLDAHHAQQVKNNVDCDVLDPGLDNIENMEFENWTPMDDPLDAHHVQQVEKNVNRDVFDTRLDNSEDLRFEDWMHMDEGIVDLTPDDMY
jgi:ankyrin repeat protein